jgi:hypothetical protein
VTAVNEVNLFEGEIEDMLNGPDGPVAVVIDELGHKAAELATALAPVMKPWNHWGHGAYNPYYQYGPPGATKKSVRASGLRYNNSGQLYSGVNVNYGPTLFLERPARQIHSDVYKFMTEALDALEL